MVGMERRLGLEQERELEERGLEERELNVDLGLEEQELELELRGLGL